MELDLFESILWNSENIAVAKLSSDWHITDANATFRMVIEIENPEGKSVVDFVSADDAANWEDQTKRMMRDTILLHFSRSDSSVTSLRSRLYTTAGFQMLVGEVPVRDLIAAEAVMTNLNNTISTLARENARKSNELKRQSEELRATLHELDNSYWHLKKIQELLPICMICNKVKSGTNQWEDIAEYLKKNSLFLSHGLCPDCLALFEKS